MLKYSAAYMATAVVFLAADLIWLSRTIGLYRNAFGDIMAERPNLKAASLFYLMYIVGILVFAVMPANDGSSWLSAIVLGGLFGLIAFATYDLTNLATLKRWSPTMSAIDMAWGTFVTALSALAGFAAIQFAGG